MPIIEFNLDLFSPGKKTCRHNQTNSNNRESKKQRWGRIADDKNTYFDGKLSNGYDPTKQNPRPAQVWWGD